jgi:hypothetical protein
MKKVKNNFRPTSKRCLIRNFSVVCLFLVSTAYSAIPPKSLVGQSDLETTIRDDLQAFRKQKKTDFTSLVQKWDRVYGSASAPALLKIARDPRASNSERYVALLAHTKIRGPHDAT